MLTNRAPFAADFALLVTLLAPFLTLLSISLVRRRRYHLHRAIQSGLIVACIAAVLGLELTIRFAGGSGAFVAQADERWRSLAALLLTPHIIVAILTYVLWTWLAIRSRRGFRDDLPGRFSRLHRPLGWCVFSGLTFVAVTAVGIYATVFVL
jgi:hypothetical protein